MDLKLLRDMADEVGESLGIKIYLLELRDTNDGKELYVECDRPGFIDMDGIVAFSEAYSKRLDTIEDMFDFEYVLNCCSADPEKEITGEDYSDYIDSYVEVEYGDDKTIMGQLVEVNNEGLSIKVNNKGRIKVTEINFAAINKISLRIKI